MLALRAAPAVSAVGIKVPTVVVQAHGPDHVTTTAIYAGTVAHPRTVIFPPGKTDPIPTGEVAVTRYRGSTCSVVEETTHHDLAANGAFDFVDFTFEPQDADTFSYRANYGGDTTYAAALSLCVAVGVSHPVPELTFELRSPNGTAASTVAVGTVVHEHATAGGVAGPAVGSFDISRYPTTDCSGSAAAPVETWLTDGVTDGAYTFSSGSPATYSFRAHFIPGDDIYRGGTDICRVVTWKGVPVRTTGLYGPTGKLLTAPSVDDLIAIRLTLTGAFGTPTGQGYITSYPVANCAGTPLESVQLTLDGGVAQILPQAMEPGTRSYATSYDGDATYFHLSTVCTNFVVRADATVDADLRTASGTPTTTVAAGGTIEDHVTVRGDYGTPTGPVTWSVYSGTTCTGTATTHGPALLSAGAAVLTLHPTTAGTYSIVARYAGLGVYFAAVGSCLQFTVTAPAATQAPPTVTPTVTPTVAPPPPSAATGGTPTAQPTAGQPTASLSTSAVPTSALAPNASVEPSAVAAPSAAATIGSSGSAAPGSSVQPGQAPAAAAPDGGLVIALVALVLVLAVLLAITTLRLRRRAAPG
jgi:hypothetical protein